MTEPVAGLNRDEAAEPAPEHEHRRDPQDAADGEKDKAEPAYGLAVERPEIEPVGVGRQKAGDDSEDAQDGDHPAIGSILANAGAEMASSEQASARQSEQNEKPSQRRAPDAKRMLRPRLRRRSPSRDKAELRMW